MSLAAPSPNSTATALTRVATLTAHIMAHEQRRALSAPPPASAVGCSSSLADVVVLGYARTPIGGGPLGGAFASLTAPQLGAIAIRAAVERAGIEAAAIEEAFVGNVLSAGVGQAPARQAALAAGLPVSTPCTTVNKVCSSGLKAVMLGASAIRAGERTVVVAGGMESMSNAPFLLPRGGLRVGHATAKDSMLADGLTDAYSHVAMGTASELTAQKYHITRADQDAYAQRSYERAQGATKAGAFTREIVPVTVKGKTITSDEEVFRANFARFSSLKPTFPTRVSSSDSNASSPPPVGTITPANSSSISDGAAALVLASSARAAELSLKPTARILAQADVALSPLEYGVAPEAAIRAVVAKAGLTLAQVDAFEINEAFSVVALANIQLLGLDPTKVNIRGGAVSLGHPIGCSGARILCTLLSILEDQGATIGVAALCNGGGGASAICVQLTR